MEVPSVVITGGAPSDAEAEAVRLAVVALWRADVAAGARSASGNPWVAAARRDGLDGAAAVARARRG